ncbi:MAG: dipicolinate synthase subunit DpsA [Oscillospiraceae bacterium]
MLQNKTILVAGGDLRNVHLAKLLSVHNTVYTIGLEKAEDLTVKTVSIQLLVENDIVPDYIIFPMPVGSDEGNVNTPFSDDILKIEDILSIAVAKTHILGGKLTDALRQRLETMRLSYTDYLLRDELAILNAVPTAEGAIQIAMEELATTIYGLDVLIVGYGRISKVLSRMLSCMGAKVTVSARKFSDIAWIQVNGFIPIHTCEICDVISNSQLIFNTVPATILDEALLSKVKRDCLLIDLASKPGGIDFETAKKLGLKTIWALSLPGKVAPISAGKIIFNTIQNIESERRYSLE